MGTKLAYKKKGSRAVVEDLGRLGANLFWAGVLGGIAGGLASRTWRGAGIGALALVPFTTFVMSRKATREGRLLSGAVAAGGAVGAGALFLASGTPATAPPQTAGLSHASVYGHPLSMRGTGCACHGGTRG